MLGYDPTDIRGQERQTDEASQLAKARQQLVINDFKWVIRDKRGRRFVWRLLESTGVFRSSFTGNSETYFREGARNVGLQVLGMIHEHAPEAYQLMLTEQHDDRPDKRHDQHANR